jgi:uncharacterized protein (DUF488 family)
VSEILTVGHSTHPIERFLELLRSGGVETVADVRRYPGSRRNPQFNAGDLRAALAEIGIEYVQLGDDLGGRRSARTARGAAKQGSQADSAWRNRSFAAYAAHMESDDFARGVARLEQLGRTHRTAFIGAEADWHRCHRRLIADALVARGWRVRHLRADGRLEDHPVPIPGPSSR